MKKIKLFAALLTLVFATTILSACVPDKPKDGGKATGVTIGTLHLVNGELIAEYEKWYEKELGVPVKLIKFDSGRDINSAIASGSIDIGQEGTSPAALAISNNLDIEVIWIGDIIGSAETLVAKNGSGIKTVKDLVGKKVATPFASTAHYSLLNALKLEGVDEHSVKILDLQPDDIFATWQRGDIDAAYVWFPVLGELLKDGTVVTDSHELAGKGILTADLSVARKPFAEANPEIVTKFVALQLRANDIIHNDRPKATREVASVLGIKPQEAAEQLTQFEYLTAPQAIEYLEGSLAKTLKDTADFLVLQKSIKKAPDEGIFKSRVTSKFVKAATK